MATEILIRSKLPSGRVNPTDKTRMHRRILSHRRCAASTPEFGSPRAPRGRSRAPDFSNKPPRGKTPRSWPGQIAVVGDGHVAAGSGNAIQQRLPGQQVAGGFHPVSPVQRGAERDLVLARRSRWASDSARRTPNWRWSDSSRPHSPARSTIRCHSDHSFRSPTQLFGLVNPYSISHGTGVP